LNKTWILLLVLLVLALAVALLGGNGVPDGP